MTPPSHPACLPLEAAKRLITVDMSPEAIDQRMRDVSELWKLWQTLRHFRVADAQGQTRPMTPQLSPMEG